MLSRLFTQVGGQSAVTWWAWLITLPFAVLISSVYATPPTVQDVLAWTVILIGIHCVLGLIMLLAHYTVLPAKPRPSRPVTALALFAIMGVARALLLSAGQTWTGLGAFDLMERLAFNVIACMFLFSLLAIVIDEYRAHAAVMARLTSAQRSMDSLREEEETTLRDLDSKILREVHNELAHHLKKPDLNCTDLRQLSDSVVRSLSHDLAAPIQLTTESQIAEPESSFRQSTSRVLGRMEFPSPVAVVVTYSALVFGLVATRIGLVLALINAVVSSIPTLLGLWAARRWLPLPSSPVLRPITIAVVTYLIGAIAGIINAWEMALMADDFPSSIPAIAAGVVTLTLALALWRAVSEDRIDRQERMALAVTEEAQEVSRLQQLQNSRRLDASRFLHGTIQNELAAASIRQGGSEDVATLISEAFNSYGGSTSRDGQRENLQSLLNSWATILDIDAGIDEGCWEALDDQPERALLMVDIVSEGLTNTVRHSTGHSFTLRAHVESSKIHLTITTTGRLKANKSAGIGLVDLKARGANISLSEHGGSTVLTADL